MATLIKTDKNGTQYFEGEITCDRCNGDGIYYIGVLNGRPLPSWVDNGVCFKCGGRGKVMGKYKVYTPEYEAKLNARRQARWEAQQKAIEEQAAKEAEERRAKEEAERIAREKAEAEERERKAISKHIGQVGDKIDEEVILEKRAWYEAPSFAGYGTETRYIFTFRDSAGNALVWKTSKGIVYERGEKVHLKGTIKEHSEYDDEKQTVLTRCKVTKEAEA